MVGLDAALAGLPDLRSAFSALDPYAPGFADARDAVLARETAAFWPAVRALMPDLDDELALRNAWAVACAQPLWAAVLHRSVQVAGTPALRNDALSQLHGRAAAWFRSECEAAEGAQVDWQGLLRTWLHDRLHDRLHSDWSLWPPSRKHLHRGLVLPSVGTPSPGRLVFAVDTSGSMSDSQIAQIYCEIRAFRETFPCGLMVLQADARVHSVEEYGELDGSEIPPRVQITGRGGTDFRPVFRWLAEQDPFVDATRSPLVFATDGYGTFPSAPPACPVIWLRTPRGLQESLFPFGVVVALGV